MDVREFAEWVKKNNYLDQRKSIFAILAFAGFSFLYAIVGDGRGIAYFVIGGLILIMAALEVGRYQWERYFNIGEIDFASLGDDVPGNKKSISQVVRLHAFPVEEYLEYVFKQMKRPFRKIMSISTIMAVTAWGYEGKGHYGLAVFMLALGIICAFCVYAVGIIKKKHFLYQLETGEKGSLKIIFTICTKILTVVEVIFVIGSTFAGIFLLWIVIFGLMQLPIEETKIVLRNYPGIYNIFLIIICIVVAFIGLGNNERKKFAKVMYVIAFLCFLAAFVLASYENQVYTEFAGEEFRVHNLWNEKVYGMEEIEGFRIYADDGELQMDLVFKDRVVKKVFGMEQVGNELYEEKYFDNYNFVADYIEKLQKLGVEGELCDVEQLEESVEELNSDVQEGLRRIVELMAGM